MLPSGRLSGRRVSRARSPSLVTGVAAYAVDPTSALPAGETAAVVAAVTFLATLPPPVIGGDGDRAQSASEPSSPCGWVTGCRAIFGEHFASMELPMSKEASTYDSLNEGDVAALLQQAGLRFERHKPLPVADWPWRTARSREAPKCDFYLSDSSIYIEVKGWMTLYALAKSAWMCGQDFRYYFFQNDDETWEPFEDSPCRIDDIDRASTASLRRCSRRQQIQELVWFTTEAEHRGGLNELTRSRVRRHIQTRMKLFRDWVGDFP
jgi:hypothetical protein